MKAGVLALALLLAACQPAPPVATASPLPSALPAPAASPLAARRLFGQPEVMAATGYGAWFTGVSLQGADVWLVSRFPAAVYRFSAGAVTRPLALSASLHGFSALSVAGGACWIADAGSARLYRYEAGGPLARIAGSPTALGTDPLPSSTGDGGLAASATLDLPHGVAVTPVGDVYFTEAGSGKLRHIQADGTIGTLAADLEGPTGLALAPGGDLVFCEGYGGRIRRRTPAGGLATLAEALPAPYGVAVDERGWVWASIGEPHQLLAIRPDGGQARYHLAGVGSPGALSVQGRTLAVIDAADGSVWQGELP